MENLKDSITEIFPERAETIPADSLEEIIYRGESIPQDTRFLPFDHGGVFKYFFVNEVNNPLGGIKNYPIVKVGDMIVGLSELELDPYKPNNLWIKFISVDPAYQGKGYAKRLAEEIVRFAKSGGYSLEHSMFLGEGKEKILGLVDMQAEKNGVKIIDSKS